MPDETRQVVIVLAYTPDGQVDHDRLGTTETYPRGQARRMVDTGEARWLDDPRNIDDGYTMPGEQAVPAAVTPGSAPDEAPLKPLSAMSKTELRGAVPAKMLAELGANPTRLELLAAARRAHEDTARTFDNGGDLPSGLTPPPSNTDDVDGPVQANPATDQQ